MFRQSDDAGAVNVDDDVRVSITLKYIVDAGTIVSHNDRLNVLQLTAWKMILMAALDGAGLEAQFVADLDV